MAAAFGLLASGCQFPLAPASAPTSSPTTTFTPAPTSTPTPPPTPSPLNLLTPAIVIEPSDVPPSATPTPLDFGLPPEELVIFQPGPGSQVVSPFSISGRGGPARLDTVHLRLLADDGRVLAERDAYLMVYPGNAGRFVGELSYQIDRVAEEARLEISTDHPRDGKIGHLASVNLILLSIGDPLLHPASAGPERLTIARPKKNEILRGGSVLVRGGGWTESDLPLIVELLDRSGSLIGSAEAMLQSPTLGQLGAFEVVLDYQVAAAQPGRIVVYEQAQGYSGVVHLASLDVKLEP